jgi:threonine dehydrogenase-like Zn-dependent dehydrogenase
MRALLFDRQLSYRTDYPDPAPCAGESIVRVTLAGICGTDLEIARGYMGYRGVPGHEFVGRVEDSANPRLKGRRVVGEINAACGRCEWCAAGLGRHCPTRTVLGILGRDGAFAEYLRLPDENLFVVPDSITDEAAVFVEPLAAAYEIFAQIHLAHNRRIAVLGDGRLGALVALALRAEGYLAIVAGHHPEKLALLARLGLDTIAEETLDEKFDVVIDCTGRGSGLARAIALVRPRGTIILKSTAAAGAEINLAPIVVNEVTVLGSRCGRFAPALAALAPSQVAPAVAAVEPSQVAPAVAATETSRVDPRPLISATVGIAYGVEAMKSLATSSPFKVLLKPS